MLRGRPGGREAGASGARAERGAGEGGWVDDAQLGRLLEAAAGGEGGASAGAVAAAPAGRAAEGGASEGESGGRAIVPSLPPGATAGRYTLLGELGRGGMGVVYSAYDPVLDRKIALKLLRAGGGGESSARLLREARALARLSHPNVVAVHDAGVFEGRVFLAMEYVRGETLASWLRGAPRAAGEVCRVFLEAGRGLAAAHAAGLVHRDFKPQNVLLGGAGGAKVTDFGLVRRALGPAEAAPASAPGRVDVDDTLTREGTLMGTPRYMSPEQRAGGEIDARSDQYSFCVALYEALYGDLPFAAGGSERPSRPTPGPGAGPRAQRALRRGLSPDPAARFASMGELLAELAPAPRSWRLRAAAAVALGAVALAAAGAPRVARYRAERRCAEAPGALAEVWGERARAEARAAFLASGRPLAEGAWAAAAQGLDRRVSAWSAIERASCERRARGEGDVPGGRARARCLEYVRQAVVAVAGVLRGGAGPAVVEYAPDAVMTVPDPSACEGEAAQAVWHRPDGAGPIDEASTLRRLAEGAAAVSMRRVDDTREIAGVLAREADASGDRALGAEAYLLLGRAESAAGRGGDAERALARALWLAEASGRDVTLLRALGAATFVAGSRLGRHDEADRLAARGDAVLARLGRADAPLEGEFDLMVGTFRLDQGRYAEAIERFDRARAGLAADPGGVTLLARVENSACLTFGKARQVAAGLAACERAVALAERGYGPGHPRTAAARSSLGRQLYFARRHRDAIAELSAAFAAQEALTPTAPSLANPLNYRADAFDALGDFELAKADRRRALAILERTQGGGEPHANGLFYLGRTLVQAGEHEAARAAFEQALALYERHYGREHDECRLTVVELAGVAFARGKVAEARARLGPAVAALEASLGPEHLDIASAQTLYGRVLWAAGAPAEALAPLERAARALEKVEVPGPDEAETWLALARALAATGGDGARARALAERALVTFDEAGPAARVRRDEAAHWLAGGRP